MKMKKMSVEMGGWTHDSVVLALLMVIFSIVSEHQHVGAQTTAQTPPVVAGTKAPEPTYSTYLGDLCQNSSTCSAQVPNSECKDSGDNSGTMRCRCSATFYPYNPQNSLATKDIKCGKVLTSAIKTACVACENNEGTCVDDAAGPNGVFCQCPISRSGDNCEVIHVNVSCSMTAMKICYSAHTKPLVDFTDGWRMYTLDHQKTPICRSTTVNTTDTQASQPCPIGYQELVLSLNDTELAICGTKHVEDAHNRRYMNKIEIQKFDSSDEIVSNASTIMFSVYCSFTAYQDQTFPGIGVGRVNGNEEGTQVNPNITFQVTDRFGRKIGGGVTLLVGDLIKFVINLTLDGTYESLQVMRVTASTSPSMPDSTAETRALMNGGCPIPGEVTGESWYWTGQKEDKVLKMQSGAVPIFKLSSSPNLFIHCALKLCMAGDISCSNNDKATCESKGRMKRAAAEPEVVAVEHHGKRQKRAATNVNVQTGLRVEDPNASPQTDPLPVGSPGFIALLVILGVIAAVLIVVTIIVAVKANRRKSASGENYQPRPQLFALPRISRTHERF